MKLIERPVIKAFLLLILQGSSETELMSKIEEKTVTLKPPSEENTVTLDEIESGLKNFKPEEVEQSTFNLINNMKRQDDRSFKQPCTRHEDKKC